MKSYEINGEVTFAVSLLIDAENQDLASTKAMELFVGELSLSGKASRIEIRSVNEIITGTKINEIPANDSL